MRNAIGFLIILFGLSQFFSTSISALDGAARETFKTVEIAAVKSQQQILEEK